jgi:bloom syndrome protein
MDQLLAIPGIDPDKVERYGSRFLPLIRNSKRLYEEMRGNQDPEDNNDVVPDPNHDNVINIISSSEDEYSSGEDIFNDASNLDATRGSSSNLTTTSRYFETSSGRSAATRAAAATSTQCKLPSRISLYPFSRVISNVNLSPF